MKKILVAGVGNPLRQDDAFGVEVVKRMIDQNPFPELVEIQEVGIGGIHLVQELHANYEVLILVDAVDWKLKAGDVSFRVVDKIRRVEDMPAAEKRDFLADMHYTNPVRAMMLAQSLNVLPKEVYLLGGQAKETEDFAIGMSKEIEQAIPKAVDLLNDWLDKRLNRL